MATMDLEILGDRIVNDLVGDDKKPGAFDASFLINAAAELADRGVSYEQQKSSSAKTAGDNDAKLQRAITADAAWAGALATLDIAQQGGDKQKVAAAQALANSAQATSASVGAGLPQELIDKRVQTAQAGANRAASESLAAPSDLAKTAKMSAWQRVAVAVATPQAMTSALVPNPNAFQYGGARPTENFLTRSYGGVPGWGIGLVGAAALTGIIMIIRRK